MADKHKIIAEENEGKLVEAINRASLEDWEVVNFTSEGQYGTHRALLRRPLSPAQEAQIRENHRLLGLPLPERDRPVPNVPSSDALAAVDRVLKLASELETWVCAVDQDKLRDEMVMAAGPVGHVRLDALMSVVKAARETQELLRQGKV